MAKKSTKKRSKKKFPVEAKIIIVVALALFFTISLFFVKTGLLGKITRGFVFGLFGFTGYFIPLYIALIFLFNLSPKLKKVRFRFIVAMTLFLIASFLTVGIVKFEYIQKLLLSDNVLLYAYKTGSELNSSGVVGNLFVVLSYKLFGLIGMYILDIAIILLGLFSLTKYSVFAFKFNKKPKNKKVKKQVTPTVEYQDDTYELEDNKREINTIPEDFNTSPEKRSRKSLVKTETNTKASSKKKKDSGIEIHSYEGISDSISVDNTNKKSDGVYNHPSINIFQTSDSSNYSKSDSSELIGVAEKIESILSNFQIKAKVINITNGPIINRYELELEPGTKISKIANLSDDLAMHLAVQQVRVAPVVGKAAIGIEVPNTENSIVFLGDILRSKEFKNYSSPLKFALGKDVSGKPIVADLSKMPHLLIAGSTGSGKSVCVNTIITSFLYNTSPEELKLLMIDPKVVELNNYNGIPHLALPVVTDPKKASQVLSWAVGEMTERYNKIADVGAKNIDGYNKKSKDDFLPRIVIIIDELADLMMVAPSQVEDSIARLTQMARAAGIHLIVATQRPSADVITGQIKTNIPSRISFAVSSAVDSRIILDRAGAERLLGKGDMLFMPMGKNSPKRVQGAYISEHEIIKLIKFIKDQEIEVEYNEEITSTNAIQTPGMYEEDVLLEDAIKLVLDLRTASASMLQRKFKIGYNRAGRLIDYMEERGIIGPSRGSKPREVLVDSNEYEV